MTDDKPNDTTEPLDPQAVQAALQFLPAMRNDGCDLPFLSRDLLRRIVTPEFADVFLRRYDLIARAARKWLARQVQAEKDYAAEMKRELAHAEHVAKYPNAAKVAAHRMDYRRIEEFMAFLEDQGIELAVRGPGDCLCSSNETLDPLFLKYIGVDAAELEKERRAMLDEMRAAQEEGENP